MDSKNTNGGAVINEMKRHIRWADKLFDVIRGDVNEVGVICRITDENIKKWKHLARELF